MVTELSILCKHLRDLKEGSLVEDVSLFAIEGILVLATSSTIAGTKDR